MVLRWRRINGRNVQVNVDEDKIKEKWTDEMIQDEIEKGTLGTILLVVLLLIRCTD